MFAMDCASLKIGALCALALAAGCNKDVRADIPELDAPSPPVGNEGFKAYVEAAALMEASATKHIGRTAWTPDQRDFIIEAARVPITKIAGKKNVIFGKTWTGLFNVRPSARGWRTMGRALAWRIDKAVKNGDHSHAISSLVTAVQMATALSSSDSQDADLGLEIMDECVNAIWQSLPKFGAGELNRLYSSLAAELSLKPLIENIDAQERAIVFSFLEWVRDQYQRRDFDAISNRLGKAVLPAVKYLEELVEESSADQQKYFNDFRGAMEEELEQYQLRITQAPYEWQSDEEEGVKPWSRFVRAFITSSRVYTVNRAKTRTKLRLLAIDGALLARFKSTDNVPRDLSAFPQALRIDPYTGTTLVYIPRGVDYKLYSCGPNGSDDMGTGDDVRSDR